MHRILKKEAIELVPGPKGFPRETPHPSIMDKLPDAIERLESLEGESRSKMEIPDIVRAVIGSEGKSDKGLESLVKLAFQASERPMSLTDMALGVLSIDHWRKVWS